MRAKARAGDRLVGITAADIAASGARRVGRLTGVEGGLPVCEGERLAPAVVVWCTGYAPDFRWIDLPVTDADGAPRHQRGESMDVEGLYWLGLKWQYRETSSLIGGVGEDAAWVAERVAMRVAALA